MDLTPVIIRAVLESLPAMCLPRVFVETECVQTGDPEDQIDLTELWENYCKVEWRKPMSEILFRHSLVIGKFDTFEEGEDGVLVGWKWLDKPNFPWARFRKLKPGAAKNYAQLRQSLGMNGNDFDRCRRDPTVNAAMALYLGR